MKQRTRMMIDFRSMKVNGLVHQPGLRYSEPEGRILRVPFPFLQVLFLHRDSWNWSLRRSLKREGQGHRRTRPRDDIGRCV